MQQQIIDIVDRVIGERPESLSANDLDRDLTSVGMTSLKMVRFISLLESEMGIRFPLETLHSDNFKSIASVVNIIEDLQKRSV
ncbi:acyl carrier protein [Pseudobacteriovorax antillogorgiicola]|uniref:Acyl carrier protein n=1 Tax=Pseudobacteriovorax antillogorgiicola TaxID=1513793 RepID=A0A1Y6BES7_9BACT|nr:acyl carrier protein [Pseudobacteriovorax antillogorgiicola]TCS57552.1 acyl carrier protein [Pseudobacteriovorax antillogorgiicola]SME99801.1 Acyl carrier protein [Pseudobacteriovorax antillogorgiicola]